VSELWEQPIHAQRGMQRGSTTQALLSLLLVSVILAESLMCFPLCGDALAPPGIASAGIGTHGVLRGTRQIASVVNPTPQALQNRLAPSSLQDLDCACSPALGHSTTSAPDTPVDHLHPHEHVAEMTAIVLLLAATLLQPRPRVVTRVPVSMTPVPPLRPPLQPSR
jgi:hypothetical protein